MAFQKNDRVKVYVNDEIAAVAGVAKGTFLDGVVWSKASMLLSSNDDDYLVDVEDVGRLLIEGRYLSKARDVETKGQNPVFEFKKSDLDMYKAWSKSISFNGYGIVCKHCLQTAELSWGYPDPLVESSVKHTSLNLCKGFPTMRFLDLFKKSEAELRQHFAVMLDNNEVIREGNQIVEICEDGVRYTALRPATKEQIHQKNVALLEHYRRKLAEKVR